MRPSPYRTPADPRPRPQPLYGAEPTPAFVVAILVVVASILYVFRDHPRVDEQGYVVVMHVTPAHAGRHR
jgi:hypothetical protein